MLYLCEGIVATGAGAFRAGKVSNLPEDSSDEEENGNITWKQSKSIDATVLQDSSNVQTTIQSILEELNSREDAVADTDVAVEAIKSDTPDENEVNTSTFHYLL